MSLFNVGKTAVDGITAVGNIFDKLFTSKEEKLNHAELMQRLSQKPGELQVELTKIEAQHRSVFVAGWRPFIGWVCGSALAYAYILRDLISWVLTIYAPSITPPPAIAMDYLNTILIGMLGLGAARTVEKIQKVSR